MKNSKTILQNQVLCAMFAAVICVCAPWSIQLAVPITLATFAICLAAQILSPSMSVEATVLYLAIGAVGVPVFAGFRGGLSVLISPTGGYLVGYVPCAFIASLFACRASGTAFRRLLLRASGAICGTVVLYALGTAWYCISTGTAPLAALAVCVLPFLPGDAVKLAAAIWLGDAIKPQIARLTGSTQVQR